MAKVNFGPLANDARGKINGIVYSKNKSGAYTRKKVTPANPNTSPQSTARNNFAGLAKAWSGTLTQTQRQSWIDYANTYPRLDIFGASITLNGLNMFISLNQVLLTTAQPIITTAPATNVVGPIPFDPTSLVVTVAGTVMTFNQTAATPSGTNAFYVFGSRPLPAGRSPARNDYRFLGQITPDAGPFPAAIDVSAIWIARFGGFNGGQRIAFLVATVQLDTGLTTVGAVMQTLAV